MNRLQGCKDQDRDGECGLVRGWMCHEAGVKAKCCETCRRLQQKKNGGEWCMFHEFAVRALKESQSLQTACTEMRPPGAGGPRETKEASAAVLAGRCAVTAAQSSS